MRILLLTFYYPPDLCAGSFRAGALVEALHQLEIPDLHVDVLTTQPNRYKSMSQEAPAFHESSGTTIRRIALPSHRSGMRDQTVAFTHFAREVLRQTRNQDWDVVVATSSRLMTAALGQQVARRTRAPLYVDIRDLFTDTIHDVLGGGLVSTALLPILRSIERSTFRSAARVNLVSEGFVDHLRQVAPEQLCSVYSNGIDEEFIATSYHPIRQDTIQAPLILYAGNIGEGQGLEHIVPDAVRLLDGRARFRIIGDGGRREQLSNALTKLPECAVELLPPMPRHALIDQYREADILFLHLNDYPAFEKVLPSKIFEYAAVGKPILAGVKGYPAQFLATHVPDAAVFTPRSAGGFLQAFNTLPTDRIPIDRADFITRFARRNVMQDFAKDIVATARSNSRS